MAHGKTHPPADSTDLVRRPLPPPKVPGRPTAPHEQSSRQRHKSRPLSRKRRAKQAAALKLELGESPVPPATKATRRDTAPEAFASPRRHAGDRRFKLTPKILALGASALVFCAFAIGYTWPGHASRKLADATPGPLTAAPLAFTAPLPPVADAPQPDRETTPATLAVNDSPELPPSSVASPAPVVALAPSTPIEPTVPRVEPSAQVASIAKVEGTPAPDEETDPEAAPVAPVAAANTPLVALATPEPAEEPSPVDEVPPATGIAARSQTEPAFQLPPLTGASALPEAPHVAEFAPKADAAPVDPTPADTEIEESLLLQEAKLLASVSKQEPALPVVLSAAEEEGTETTEAERPAPLDFSMPMAAPKPLRPWEASPVRDTELALNDYGRLVAPWSLEARAGRIGDGNFSIFHRPPEVRIPVPVPPKTVVQEPVSVMILGDSLALCGFGSRLDKRFRESANVRSTNTYMACGTVPMSWLKEPPYSSLKTYCGFWTIEDPVAANKKPASFQDTYGMGKGKPKAYPVPKVEDLFAKAAPEVLVLQTGTNLFSLFRDGKTVQPEHHIPMLRSQIQPFLAKILKLPQPPRAIYWVASPTSGRVSAEVQDFVIEQVKAMVGPMATVIDSRQLVSFPYRHMEPDQEHFIGQDMDQWADRVYDIVQRDLAAHPLPLALARPPGLTADKPAVAAAKPVGKPNANDVTAVRLTAKLVSKTKPMRLDELKPYRESLVSFIYEVQKVTEGEYTESKILVMQPAHIDNVAQPLDKLRVGKTYELTVHELQESSPWMTIKKKDDSGLLDLLPYIQISDETRFPGHQSQASR